MDIYLRFLGDLDLDETVLIRYNETDRLNGYTKYPFTQKKSLALFSIS